MAKIRKYKGKLIDDMIVSFFGDHHSGLTFKELKEGLNTVPRSTLHNHFSSLLKDRKLTIIGGIGNKTKYGLTPDTFHEQDRKIKAKFKSDGFEYVTKVPLNSVIFGAHALLKGSQGLILPLDIYLWAGLKKGTEGNGETEVFAYNNPTGKINLPIEECEYFKKIFPWLEDFDVRLMYDRFEGGAGMGSSGALAVTLALLDLISQKIKNKEKRKRDENQNSRNDNEDKEDRPFSDEETYDLFENGMPAHSLKSFKRLRSSDFFKKCFIVENILHKGAYNNENDVYTSFSGIIGSIFGSSIALENETQAPLKQKMLKVGFETEFKEDKDKIVKDNNLEFLFDLDLKHVKHLKDKNVDKELRELFKEQHRLLSDDAKIQKMKEKWKIISEENEYIIEKEYIVLKVYKKIGILEFSNRIFPYVQTKLIPPRLIAIHGDLLNEKRRFKFMLVHTGEKSTSRSINTVKQKIKQSNRYDHIFSFTSELVDNATDAIRKGKEGALNMCLTDQYALYFLFGLTSLASDDLLQHSIRVFNAGGTVLGGGGYDKSKHSCGTIGIYSRYNFYRDEIRKYIETSEDNKFEIIEDSVGPAESARIFVLNEK